jgi:hypothetical protein
MGLAQSQRLQARLYTDAALRERFLADPRGVGASFGVEPEDAEQLSRLAVEQVERLARSLLHKRRGAAVKLLPRAHRALGEARFAALFLRHAAGYVPSGVRKHGDDAVAFADFVARAVRGGEVQPAWVADLIRYEAAWLVTRDPDRRWTACRLRHSVGDLVRATFRGECAPGPRPTLALWFRPSRSGRLWYLSLSMPRWWPRIAKVRLVAALVSPLGHAACDKGSSISAGLSHPGDQEMSLGPPHPGPCMDHLPGQHETPIRRTPPVRTLPCNGGNSNG